MKNNFQLKRLQHGFTLLEVLIALVVLSIGLLGLAGLQTVSLRNTGVSTSRTVATQLAYDIADRMRSNVLGTQNGDYFGTATALGAAPTASTCYTAGGCTAAQMAAMDLYVWRSRLARELNGGVGVVCRDATDPEASDAGPPVDPKCDGATGAPIYVKIFWQDRKEDGSFSQQTFVSSVQPI
jgi:type IV pilus assembly protein PilV